MTSPRVARAAELLAELPELLAAGGLSDADQVTVTGNQADLDKVPLLPGAILLHPGPVLEFPAPGVVAVSWQLVVVAGPGDDLHAAWSRLDAIVEALRVGGLHLTRAEPGDYPRPGNPVPFPGYTLTVDEQLDDY